MLRSLALLTLVIVSVFSLEANLLPSHEAPPLELLVREALERNPGIQSWRYRERAAEQRIDQMRSWMPPTLSYQYNPQPMGTMEDFRYMNMNIFSLSQMIPFPGKIAARVDMEEAERKMVSAERGDSEIQLVAEVKKTYVELWMVQKKIQLNRELQSLVEDFVQSARRMYEVDMAGLEAILSAQTNLAKLRTEERSMWNEYNKVLVMLNQLLNREPETPLGKIVSLPPETIPMDLEELPEHLIARRPDLQAMRYEIETIEAEIRSARREYYPDIMVDLMYMQMPGTMDDRFGVMISLQIPLAPWSSNMVTRRVSEARYQMQSREKTLENMVSMARAEIRQGLLDLKTQHDIIRMYREEVLPQAEQTAESVLGAFRAGKTDYLMVLDSYRMLEMLRMEYYTAVAAFHTAMADLERQAGIVSSL